MSKLNQVWVIASAKATIADLTGGAAALGENVALLLAGDRENTVNAGTVYYFGPTGDQASFLSYLPAMVALVKEKKPDLILADLTPNGRIAAGQIAAAVGTNVMTDISALWLEDGRVLTQRMVYGGSAYKTERAGAVAVACVGAGVFEARGETPAGDMIELLAVPAAGIRFKGRTVKAVQSVNLAAAKKVVSVGRGLGAAEHLSCVNDFAAVIGAEIGCSRPVAEEEKWLPKERYIGISGCMVKPDLYIAAGISGQVQHMVGANQSGTIVAINKDKSAPIFKQCDYGIVGDLRTVLPALTERLK